MAWTRIALALGAALAAAAPATAHAQQVVPHGDLYTLTKSGLNPAAENNIQAAANRYGGKVGFAEIFNNAEQATRERDGAAVPGSMTGFRWEANNETEGDWRPQGITGSADAYASGFAGAYKVLITSWYHRPDPSYARITLHNTTASNTGAPYRHVLLVSASSSGTVTRVESHAGGLAWIGNHLYVASTDRLRVFNLDDIIKVKPEIGRVFGYKYILPQSGAYTANDNPGLKFSSVSLDRTGSRPNLVTSEFRENAGGGRILRWPLNDGGLMGATVNRVAGWKAQGVENVQGALMKNGRFALTSSLGKDNPSYLYTGAPNTTLRRTTWSRDGAEDLFLVGDNDRLYTLTEFEGSRRVFAVDASDHGL